MSKVIKFAVLLTPPLVIVGSGLALAQQPPLGRPLTSSWVSTDSGNQMSNFRARVAGGQCVAQMKYKTREGYAGETQWVFTARQENGYTRCTGGQWRDLSGSGRTGSMTDIIAYKGKFYWAQR